MIFETARRKLTDSRQTALDSVLAEWTTSSELPPLAAANLQRENGSSSTKFADYLGGLADKESQLRVLDPGLRVVFEQVGTIFAFAGHEATPFKDAIFGRAILLVKFARFLAPQLDELGCFDTEEDIRAILRRLDGTAENATASRFRVYFDAMRATPLGRGAIFATFVKSATTGSLPWTSPVPDARAIRSSIGLGEDPDGQDYMLFAYRLPADTAPLVPTTASPGWFYQRWFRPNPTADADVHGWTVPIDPLFARRPEVVHSEIDGATLVFPIYIADA
jgi:hypothetical protein